MNGWEDFVINDAMMPSQFADMQRGGQATGEDRLLLAILMDARHCIEYTGERWGPKRRKNEAEAWVMSDATGIFSFRMICEHFNLNLWLMRSRFMGPDWHLRRRTGVARANKVTMRRYQRVRA